MISCSHWGMFEDSASQAAYWEQLKSAVLMNKAQNAAYNAFLNPNVLDPKYSQQAAHKWD